jgi:hypothetical protein
MRELKPTRKDKEESMRWYRVSYLGIMLAATVRLAAAADVVYVPSRVAFAQGDQLPPSSVQGAASSVLQMEAPAASSLQGTDPWTAATAHPTTIARYAFVQVGEDLYVISGVSAGGTPVKTVRRYNATTNLWTSRADIPVGSEAPAGAFFGGKIYVADGASTAFHIYDVATNTWSNGPPRPVATDSFGAAAGAFNGNVYFVGGDFPPTPRLSIYNIASNTWSAGPAAPSPFQLGGYAQSGQFLYLIGGFPNPDGLNSRVSMRLDMETNTWSTGPAWTPARADFALAATGTKLFAIGGDSDGGGFFDASAQVDELDTSTWPGGAWVPSPDNLPSPRQANRAGFVSTGRVGGEIWSTGGIAPGNVFLDQHLFRAAPIVATIIITPGGSSIVSAGPNGVLDPGETVTVSLGAQNSGNAGLCTTGALTGTLQVSGGVTSPSGPQNYGALCSGSPAVFRDFTFTVDPALACGSSVTASLVMMDGATNYGTLTYAFTTGSTLVFFIENFDGVVAPALPAGWTTAATGAEVPWVTSAITPVSAPNAAFAPDSSNVGNTELVTPSFAAGASGARLTFKNLYHMQNLSDGMVLEISSNGGSFADIIGTGGSFVSGGYTGQIFPFFLSPIGGRNAWTGRSGGTAAVPAYITTVVNLPPAANGQNVQLKWRVATDNGLSQPGASGARIDDITIANLVCGGSAPVPSAAVSRKTHGPAGPFDINLPLVPLAGAVGIEDRNGAVAGEHQMVVTFASPVTVGGVSVTTGAGSASFSVSGAVATINFTEVTNAQRLGVTLANVHDGTNLGSVMVPMGVLSGDTNGNGSVNAGDVGQTKAQSGLPATGANFRTDVNSNGAINAADIGLIKSQAGGFLP